MAAETSSDAQVPVMIALSRLNIYFILEYLRDVSKYSIFIFAKVPEWLVAHNFTLSEQF